ncbi:hypothetical protein SAMN02910353_00888 [Ruminococcus sp. YRD2003]|uniref:hypothetical protein n=1 Tax=Ruminococcus sp. YRD2003 TaxID=1452313 RepID=UPI0008B58FF0|nr:hypothetical protein SAMN02910353_00888 [Ruminococcus flavefaciens]
MDETYIIPTVIDDHPALPAEDDTEMLAEESSRRRREGHADDIIAMQAAVCMLVAAALLITNIFRPDVSGELFARIRELSGSADELFRNPLELLTEMLD